MYALPIPFLFLFFLLFFSKQKMSTTNTPILQQLIHYSRNAFVKIVNNNARRLPLSTSHLIEQAENYLFGREGYPKDYKLSVELLRKAAYTNKNAFAILGFCYEFGFGVSNDFKTAEKCYISAIHQDHDERTLFAISRLAFLRKYGRPGVVIDRIEAQKLESLVEKGGSKSIAWIQRAATQDHCSASQYCLGVFYHDGLTFKKDERAAFRWYKKSAEQGNCRGQGILGYCYGEGFGVEKNEAEAMRWYRLAAAQGETVAIYNIGYCYEDGIGVAKNAHEAVKWYTIAAEQGNAFAQNSLGYCYEDGIGVEENHIMASKWYKLSANQGYPWAQW